QLVFELKIYGFRAIAFIEGGKGELISRNGKTFHGFAELATWIAEHLRVENAVLDGEIACVDEYGRPEVGTTFPFPSKICTTTPVAHGLPFAGLASLGSILQ